MCQGRFQLDLDALLTKVQLPWSAHKMERMGVHGRYDSKELCILVPMMEPFICAAASRIGVPHSYASFK